jgi:hypothetical protein
MGFAWCRKVRKWKILTLTEDRFKLLSVTWRADVEIQLDGVRIAFSASQGKEADHGEWVVRPKYLDLVE